MEWARKWWTVNATMVALMLQVSLGLTSVTFASERALASVCGRVIPASVRPCRRKSNSKIANESCARGLFTMMVVVLMSSVGISSYWNAFGDTSLTFGKVAPTDYPKRDRAGSKGPLGIEVLVSYAFSLLVTLGAYLHRWTNGPVIRDLNRNFRTLYRSHPGALDSLRRARRWDRYGRLAAKQTFEMMALGMLWLNLKPFSDTGLGDGEDYRVGKLISSMGSMLPAVVCLLVSAEMGINFSFIALSMAALNRSLATVAQCARGVKVMPAPGRMPTGRNCPMIESMWSRRADRDDYLRNLIIQYDKLGDVASTLVQFYSPILLLIIGMHFVLFTMQLFLCYREMAHTTSGSVCFDDLGQILLPLLSVVSRAVQIIFIVDTTADFNRKLEDDTLDILSSLTNAIHAQDEGNRSTSREIDQSVTILSLIVSRIQADINLYGYFDLDWSLIMTIVASTCSYLIVLMQVM